MFENFSFKFYYNIGESGHMAEAENGHFSLNKSFENGRLKISVLPKVKMELVHFEISADYNYAEDACVMPNGYQSWSLTKEYNRDDRLKGIRFPTNSISYARELAAVFGDYNFKSYPKTTGVFHGYSFGYIRNGKEFELIGSLCERSGYTIINFDMRANKIILEKEVEGKVIDGEYALYDVMFAKGGYDEVFDKYFETLNVKPCRVNHTCGYTSWYNYFTKINEDIILRDLKGLMRIKEKVNIYQIDDGYQSAIGDWETTDTAKFPRGMKFIADSIHEKGLLAGLWLAPFYAQKNSKVALEHPDWIVKDKNGRQTKGFVGGRACVTLNFYIPECAAYIKKFFDTVVNKWGFDMVKLDFLCTACLVPFGNRTRGEIMCDAMEFLRECVGDKLILGCGVPLFPSFGKVDFCRIGSDVDIQFKPRFIFQLTNNEVVSTQTSIQNAIFRRCLDGRAFGNDPDVFFMREINLKYTESEKRLVAEVNKAFGRLLFISDNVGDFSDKQLAFLNEIYTKSQKQIDFVDYKGNNTAEIYYTENGKKSVWKLNWLTGENSTSKLK